MKHTFAEVGIAIPYGMTGETRTVCPQCSPSRRKSRDACLAVNVEKGVWRCWHCGWKGGLQGPHVTQEWAVVSRPPIQLDARKRAALRRVWGEAYPLTANDPVLSYLYQRGIALSPGDLPHILRYHHHLLYKHDNGRRTFHPAMLACVHDPVGRPVSIHRTYLTADGHKASVLVVKKLMPAPVPGATRGGAIRLYPAGESLAVAEGIETALSVRLSTGLPTWATICAHGMANLVVPSEVHLVIVCADNDTAGLKAAKALAHRLLVEQRRVKILTPETPGADWADRPGVAHG